MARAKYQQYLDKSAFDAALIPGIRTELTPAHYDDLRSAEAVTFAPCIGAEGDLKPDVAEQRDCPFCDAPAAASDELLQVYGLHYVTCRQCEGTYTREIVKQAIDRARYEGSPAVAQYNRIREVPAYGRLVSAKALYIAARLTEMAEGRPGRLLEVGSADGVMLRAARELGWTALGIEPFAPYAEICREQGFEISLGYFPDDVPESWQGLDAIVLLDVLEHAVDPRAFIAAAHRRLALGGLMGIQVPNLDSLFIRLQGARNINFTHGHWVFFTAASLGRMMRQHGFEQVFLETIITELDGIRSFPDQEVAAAFRALTGTALPDPAALDAETLHRTGLGYKLLGIYRKR